MRNQDRVELLQEAQRLLNEAADLVDSAAAGTSNEGHTKGYLSDHIRAQAEDWNRYNTSCQTLIDQIDGDDDERMDHGWFESEREQADWQAALEAE